MTTDVFESLILPASKLPLSRRLMIRLQRAGRERTFEHLRRQFAGQHARQLIDLLLRRDFGFDFCAHLLEGVMGLAAHSGEHRLDALFGLPPLLIASAESLASDLGEFVLASLEQGLLLADKPLGLLVQTAQPVLPVAQQPQERIKKKSPK